MKLGPGGQGRLPAYPECRLCCEVCAGSAIPEPPYHTCRVPERDLAFKHEQEVGATMEHPCTRLRYAMSNLSMETSPGYGVGAGSDTNTRTRT